MTRYFLVIYICLSICILDSSALAHLNRESPTTNLMDAIKRVDVHLVGYLVQFVDLDVRDNFGQTALIYAVRYKNNFTPEIIQMLISEGANVNIIDAFGWAALDYVDRYRGRRDVSIYEVLRAAGARMGYEILLGSEGFFQNNSNKNKAIHQY